MEFVYKQLYNADQSNIGFRMPLNFGHEIADSKLTVLDDGTMTLDLDLNLTADEVSNPTYYNIPVLGKISVLGMFKHKYALQNIFLTLNLETYNIDLDDDAPCYLRIINVKITETKKSVSLSLQLVDDFSYLMSRLYSSQKISKTYSFNDWVNKLLVYKDLSTLNHTRNHRLYQVSYVDSSASSSTYTGVDFGSGSYKELLTTLLKNTNNYIAKIEIDPTFTTFKYYVGDISKNVPNYKNTSVLTLADHNGMLHINQLETEIDLSDFGNYGMATVGTQSGYASTSKVVGALNAGQFAYDFAEIEPLNDERYTIYNNAITTQTNKVDSSIKTTYTLPTLNLTTEMKGDRSALNNYFMLKPNNFVNVFEPTTGGSFRITEVSGSLTTVEQDGYQVDVFKNKDLKINYYGRADETANPN